MSPINGVSSPRFLIAVLSALLTLVVAAFGQAQSSGNPSFVPPDSKLELLFSRDGSWTEGPAVAPDGSIFFVDLNSVDSNKVPAGRIWQLDPNTKTPIIFRSPSDMANGMKFDALGRLVIAELGYYGARRITRIDPRTRDGEVVAAFYAGKPFAGANDLVIDEKGRIYFTEYDFVSPHDVLYRPTSGVFRIDPDGTVDRIIANAGQPNGIAVSRDQKTLYVNTWRYDIFGQKAILAYDLSSEGKATFRTVLVRYELKQGGQAADGMTVDTEENLWVAVFARNAATGVAVYSPIGKELAFISTPEAAKNVAFGRGKNSKVLYITAGKSLYRIRVGKDGYQLPERQIE